MPQVVVFVQHGTIQRVFANDGVEVVVVDYDCRDNSIDGREEPVLHDGEGDPVKVYVACTSPLDEIPDVTPMPKATV